MLFILLGIVFFAFFVFAVINNKGLTYLITGMLAILCISLGLFSPLHGFEEAVLEGEFKLIPIFSEASIYALEDSEGTVTVKAVEKSEHSQGKDKAANYTFNENIKIVYIEEHSEPVLKKYIKKPKRSVLSMALLGNTIEYTVFVPESCVEKLNNKHVN